MMKRIALIACVGLAFICRGYSADVPLQVREHVLSNGMKILMVVKAGAPRITCHIYYKVGSINETPGITGIAHLHEHMMFKGTEIMGVNDFTQDRDIDQKIDQLYDKIYHEKYWKKDGDNAKIAAWQKEADALAASEKQFIIKDHLWQTLMKNGGTSLNASTSNETTGYYVTLPANKVELQMLLEADRMKNAAFREFYSEKNVVMEERRLSENTPGFLFTEQVNAAFYAATPYHWEVLGWMDDLKKLNKQDMIDFHNHYYIPNNAIAIYVGALDPQRIIALAEKYFGAIAKGRDIEPIRTFEPEQNCEKRLYGEGAAAANLTMMFHMPPAGHPDVYPLMIIADALGSGGGGGRGFGRASNDTGRLYNRLVKVKDLAVSVSARANASWYAGAFTVRGTPQSAKGISPEALEPEILAEIDAIKKTGVSDQELQKAKNKAEAALYFSLQNQGGITRQLAMAELNRGWKTIFGDLDELKKVGNEAIKAAAQKYLVKENSTIAIYKRKPGR